MARIIARTKVKPPGTPTVTALSTSELRAVFTAPAGFNIASFLPQFSFDGVIWETLATSTTGTVSRAGLNPNTRGYFRAAAVDAVGSTSAYGTIASAFTDASAASGAPSLLLALSGSTAINVTIAATPAATKSIIYYEVQRSLTGTGGWSDVTLAETDAASEIPAQDTRAPTKYVSASGTLGGFGAYTTLQAAFNAALPGDIIAIGPGTYAERAVLTRSGTAASPIYIKPYDYNDRPTFDGQYSSSVVPGWQSPYTAGMWCVIGVQAEYVTVDGLNIIRSPNGGIGVGQITNNGNFLSSSDTGVFLRGTRFIRCSVIGSETAFRTINVDGCEVFGCTFLDSQQAQYPLGTGRDFTWGSAASLMGKNISMIENTVGRCSGEGIHAGVHIRFGGGDGFAHIQVHKLILRNNRIFDTWSGPMYISNVDAAADDPSIVEGNVIWMTDNTDYHYNGALGYPAYGIGIGSESPRNDGNTAYGTNFFAGARNMILRNNVVSNALRPFILATESGQDTTNISVLNNTFYQTVPGTAPGVAAVIESYNNGQSNIVFQNNLVTDTTPERAVRNWQTPNGTWTRGYNLFPQQPPAALQAGTNVISTSPGMVDPTYRPSSGLPGVSAFDTANIKLLTSSPAINVGAVRGEVTTDIFGRTRPTGSGFYDIGAHSLSKQNTVTYADTGLAPSTVYYYRGRFVQSDGAISPYSNVVASDQTGTTSFALRVLAQKEIDNNTAANPSVTLSGGNIPVNGRDLLVCIAAYYGSDDSPVSITDDRGTGNVYTKIDTGDAVTGGAITNKATVYLCKGYTGTNAPTIMINQGARTGEYVTWCVLEVTGLTASPVDTNARGTQRGVGGSSGAVAAATPTTQAINLVLTVASYEYGVPGANVTVPSGYTAVFTEGDGSANQSGGVAYRITNAISTPTATWTWAAGPYPWHCVLVTLKVA